MFADIAHFTSLMSNVHATASSEHSKNQKLWSFNMTYEHHEQPPLSMGSGVVDIPPTGDLDATPEWTSFLNSSPA